MLPGQKDPRSSQRKRRMQRELLPRLHQKQLSYSYPTVRSFGIQVIPKFHLHGDFPAQFRLWQRLSSFSRKNSKAAPSSETSKPTKTRRIQLDFPILRRLQLDFPTLRHREPLAQGFIQVKTRKKGIKKLIPHLRHRDPSHKAHVAPPRGDLGISCSKKCGRRMRSAQCHPKNHTWMVGELRGHIPAPEIPSHIPGCPAGRGQ